MSKFSAVIHNANFKRLLPFLALVLLLHLTLIQWALSPFTTFASREPELQIVSADLRLNPIPNTVPEVLKPAPIRKVAPASRRAIVKPEPETDSNNDTQPLTNRADNTNPAAKPAVVRPPVAATAPPDDNKQALSLGPLPQYSVNPPPSAELKYRAHSQHKGQDYYGRGRINWQSKGSAFSIKGEFSALIFSLLNFSSQGSIDPKYGVSPTVYAEKRIRRSETNTHFHRERNTISFSASTLMYQRQGGEQDRASVVWQLSGIGRRDSSKFVPGAILDIAVAGARGADVWKFRVGNLEEIETDVGKMRAWRLTRSARKDSYEQSFDLWLAPQHEWYPVKLRYTSANGDFLDLSLSEIVKVP